LISIMFYRHTTLKLGCPWIRYHSIYSYIVIYANNLYNVLYTIDMCIDTRMLVEKGARADLVNIDGDTALIEACRKGHASVVELLLIRGNIRAADAGAAMPHAKGARSERGRGRGEEGRGRRRYWGGAG